MELPSVIMRLTKPQSRAHRTCFTQGVPFIHTRTPKELTNAAEHVCIESRSELSVHLVLVPDASPHRTAYGGRWHGVSLKEGPAFGTRDQVLIPSNFV